MRCSRRSRTFSRAHSPRAGSILNIEFYIRAARRLDGSLAKPIEQIKPMRTILVESFERRSFAQLAANLRQHAGTSGRLIAALARDEILF